MLPMKIGGGIVIGSGWDESAWHDGYTSQVSWTDQEWYESGWGSWDASAGESQEQGHSVTPVVGSKGNENGVQSLVLSPCLAEECDFCDTGLTLIDSAGGRLKWWFVACVAAAVSR